jgi:hypothetical protein
MWKIFDWSAPYFKEAGWQKGSVPYFQVTLAFITVVYVFETYLDWR